MQRILLILVMLLPVAVGTAGEADKAGLEFFETRIRPVLIQQCYPCHSAEAVAEKKLKGELQLDTRDGARRGGESGPAVVPGNADASLLISALKHESFEMPPEKQLPDDVIADFVKWIEMGAPDPRDGKASVDSAEIDIAAGKQLWSFRPLQPVTLPDLKDDSRVRTPIDRFIQARLEAEQIAPSSMAAPQTLIRRAYYDLIGLPPTPEDLDQFVSRAREDLEASYEQLIDHLLASEHFGERWARHWLDLVRFAESYGYAFDRDRPHAYHYRDFVIRTFNDDMPYDRFVRLQVAGDLLPEANPETAVEAPEAIATIAASGFLVAGPFTTQQTMKERERSRYEQLDDMLHIMGTSMLGLSVGCARCHSHKYDPLPTSDYYRLAACFAEVGFADSGINMQPEKYRKAKAEYDSVHKPLVTARTAYENKQMRGRFKEWYKNRPKEPPALTIHEWHHIGPFTADGFDLAYSTGFPPEKEGKIDLAKTYQDGKLKWTAQPSWEDGKVHYTLSGSNSANYLYRVIEAPVAQEITLSVGSDDGIRIWFNDKGVLKKKVVRSAAADQETLTFSLQRGSNHLLMKIVNGGGRSGFYFQASPGRLTAEIAKILEQPSDQWNDEQWKKVVDWYKHLDEVWLKLSATVAEFQSQAPKADLTMVYGARVRGTTYQFGDDTYKVYHLTRGNSNSKAKEASPGFLQVLMRTDLQEQQWLNASTDSQEPPSKPSRIAVANWITDVEHGAGHLLARVIVNRLWHYHFGRGMVATPSDFGTRGEKPSHPQLLDWLAGELIRNDWKLKPIHRLIMNSWVYMQSGKATEGGATLDPDNRLWSRRESRRLEAEIIRDALLEVSGMLDRTMYGRGTLDQKSPRRSIYLTVKRSQLIPFLKLFDAPDGMLGIGSRTETTVPPQALAMLNSPLIQDLAKKFAARVRPNTTDTSLEEAIANAYRLALSRSPNAEEAAVMKEFIQRQAASRDKETNAEALALRDFCQLVLCMNEFLYVD